MEPDDVRERSETDERIAENREPAPVAPATRNADESQADGLPPGVSDDPRSPLDPVFYDPYTARRERTDRT